MVRAGLEPCLSPALIVNWRSDSDECLRELLMRFMSQLCMENYLVVPESIIVTLYEQVSRLAFLSQELHRKQTKFFYKTRRASFNVIANLLAQEE